jgi:hypothetical protein
LDSQVADSKTEEKSQNVKYSFEALKQGEKVLTCFKKLGKLKNDSQEFRKND